MQRTQLRGQLFTGTSKHAPFRDLDEADWLVPNWATYVRLNFELPDPGPDKAVAELRKMVDDHSTPDYKGGKKGGRAKPITPRPLGDLELAKLQELLSVYEAKLKAIWQPRDAGEAGRKIAEITIAETERAMGHTTSEIKVLRRER